MKELKIEITRQTVAAKRSVKVGEVLTIPENDAKFLIHLGKAKIWEPKQKVVTEKANNGLDPKKPAPLPPVGGLPEVGTDEEGEDGDEIILADMTPVQLRAFALEMAIELPAQANKAKMIEIIEAELAGIDEEGEPEVQ